MLSNYHLLANPAGAACNLGCQYCFFLSKENLYPGDSAPVSLDYCDKAPFKFNGGIGQVHVAYKAAK